MSSAIRRGLHRTHAGTDGPAPAATTGSIIMSTSATTATTAAPTRRRPGVARIALRVLQGLIAVAYLYSAWSKLSADPQAVAGFAAIGIGDTGRIVIGIVEAAGAIGLLIPRLQGLAATCLVAWMVGATVVTLFAFPLLAVVPAVYLVAVAILAYGLRGNTAALVASLRR
jgi:uncharacterized membrane protein